jgi:hypothetical protein
VGFDSHLARDARPSASLQGLVTRLQRTAGNRAVVRLLAREAAPPPVAMLDQADLEALQAYDSLSETAAGHA